MTIGSFVSFTLYLGLLVGPVIQIVSIGSQITEAFAGLERIRELRDELPRTPATASASRCLASRASRVPRRALRVPAGRPRPERDLLRAPPGTVTALVGPSGSGKSTIIGLVAAFYRPTEGDDPRGRIRPLEGAPLRLPRPDRRRLPGQFPLRRQGLREHRLLAAGGAPRGGPQGRRDRPLRRVRRQAAGRLRHDRGRAGRQALRRAAPAGRDRAGDPGRSAHPDPGRGDLLARQRERGADPGGARGADEGAHDLRHRAPALDHPQAPTRSSSSRRAGSSSAGVTRSCSRAAAGTPTSTTGSTGWRRTSS